MTAVGYRMFGTGSAEVAVDKAGNVEGGIQYTVWTAMEGGSQVTDLLDLAGNPAAGVVLSEGGSDFDEGRVFFQAPEAYSVLYLDRGYGVRWAIWAQAIGVLVSTAIAESAQARADADAAETSAASSATSATAAAASAAEAASTAAGQRSVKTYGAVGDGVTDDRPACQAAVDAADPGEVVLFPAGTYLMSGVLNLKEGTRLSGYGATLIKASDYQASLIGYYPAGGSGATGYDGPGNVVIEGLTLDADGDAVGRTASNAISMSHSHDNVIRDVTVLRGKGFHPLEINASERVLVDNCRFLGYIQDATLTAPDIKEAIQIDYATDDNTVPRNITIRGCYFGPDDRGNQAPCVGVGSHNELVGSPFEGIVVDGCISDGCTFALVSTRNWANAVISDCVARNAAQYGYHLSSSANVTVSGCLVVAAPGAVDATNLIWVGATSTGCVVSGCVAVGGASQGICLTDSSSACSVVGCTTVDTPDAGIAVTAGAADCTISGCTIVGPGYTAGTAGAVRVTSTVTNVAVTGCKVIPHRAGTEATAGVDIETGAVDTWVFGNDFNGLSAAITGPADTTSNRI